jgi:hypothetical protein
MASSKIRLPGVRVSVSVALLAIGAVSASACREDRARQTDDGLASVTMALVAVPSGVTCFRIIAARPGVPDILRSIDLQPSLPPIFTIAGLPEGAYTFSAVAFEGKACRDVGGDSPAWVSDPLAPVTISRFDDPPKTISLRLRRPTKVTVVGDFDDTSTATQVDGGAAGDASSEAECAAASDCPGSDTECRTRVCVQGVCGVTNAATGTPVSAQTSGDCRALRCDGNGDIVSLPDASDLPDDDGNMCTSETCSGGVPSHPALPQGAACTTNGGSLCDGAGACVACLTGEQCPSGSCVASSCQPLPGDSCDGSVVISQLYTQGGNTGAVFQNDFIELHNRGATAVSLAGWSVQYASATGPAWLVTPLAGTIQPGGFFLVQEAGGLTGLGLPLADVTGTIALGAASGKVALVSDSTPLAGCPAVVVDLVGYGPLATCFEGTAALSPSSALFRSAGGCADTNDNGSDLQVATAAPRSSGSPPALCACAAPSGP